MLLLARSRPRPIFIGASLRRTLIPQPPRPVITPRPLPITFNSTSPEAQANRRWMDGLINDVEGLRTKARDGGGKEVLERWKKRGKGKLSVRERVAALLDPASPFMELSPLAAHDVYPDPLPGAGIVTGIGMVAGRKCMIIANDPTVKGGVYFPLTVKKHLRAQQIALDNQLPCIYLVESGGAALPYQADVFPDHDHFGRIFYNMARLSGMGIPQISVVHGISVAGGAYMPAMSDLVIIVKEQGHIFLAGPPLVKAATGEVVDEESLGGGEMHTSVSGVADYLAQSDSHALALAREAIHDLSPLPLPLQPNLTNPSAPRSTLPPTSTQSFPPTHASPTTPANSSPASPTPPNSANSNPLTAPPSFADSPTSTAIPKHKVPLVFLTNVSGYMVGEKAERGGIAKDGAKMVRAVARAEVEKFSIIVGGSFGAGNYGMCGRAYSPRFLFMWPNAKIGVMGPDQLSTVMHSVEGKRPGQTDEQRANADKKREELKAKIEGQSRGIYASARIWDDGIIKPSDTRDILGLGLELAHEERARRGPGTGPGSRGEVGADGDTGDWGIFRM
ncbi:hypothetical protein IAR50_003319 [Cryptococcus sp. DSM 104548]